MSFKVGETVVYPHHGAALIEAIETRTIKGEEKIIIFPDKTVYSKNLNAWNWSLSEITVK